MLDKLVVLIILKLNGKNDKQISIEVLKESSVKTVCFYVNYADIYNLILRFQINFVILILTHS